MKKIPTVFERDWANGCKVINKIYPGCEWVQAGEGIATRKIDGTSCLVRGGKLFKRREVKKGASLPSDFELVGNDEGTGDTVGWIPVGDGTEDCWHREAFNRTPGLEDGTYELVGPKVQGNRENFTEHILVSHRNTGLYPDAPRTFDELRDWLAVRDIEGLVWHHPDGRMAKVKKRDFGLRRL